MGAAEALGGLRQNAQNGAVGIVEHLRVPKPEDAPSFALQEHRPASVSLYLLGVLAAVELDAEPRLAARQIDDERRHDELPCERRSIARDATPHRQFCRRGIVAQFSRASRQLRIYAVAHGASVGWLAALANPPPAPSLSGRGDG